MVRLRKRLDPQSLVAAERHPRTGRLVPNGRRNKSHGGPRATLIRHGFSGAAGLLAAGALVTLVTATAAAAVKSTGSSDHPHRGPAALNEQTSPPSPAGLPVQSAQPSTPPAASLPPPCQLVSQTAAESALGVPLDLSDNKPTSCLYAGKAPSPFRSLEIRYDPTSSADRIRRQLAAARVATKPVTALGSTAFAHPPYVQTANGQTQFLPAEAVVPVGPFTVVISAVTLDEGNSPGFADPAHDEAVVVAVAQSALAQYAGH